MRIVAGLLADEISDDNALAIGAVACAQKLLHPGVIIRTTGDDDFGARDRPRDGRARLEKMRIFVWVAENARYADVSAADLLGHVAIEIFRSDNRDRAAWAPTGLMAALATARAKKSFWRCARIAPMGNGMENLIRLATDRNRYT